MTGLIPADCPPNGIEGLWTERVLVQTSLGNVFAISYFHGESGGTWQRPSYFEDGEVVMGWIHMPEELF